MKFISFIASTMLIVLISQHSVMGAPFNDTEVEKSCSTGFERVDGRCVPSNSESTTRPSTTMTMELASPVTQLDTTKRVGLCPDGMQHGKNGLCEQIKPTEPTKVTFESTTDRPELNLMNCPEGTKRADDGACQEIKPFNSTKPVIDPKELRNKDGSCPTNYKPLGDGCVYVGPETPSTSDSKNSFGKKPRAGQDGSSSQELVPELPGNICPRGTVHADFGLCQKVNDLPGSRPMKTDDRCPDGSKPIDDKCGDKSTTQISSESTTTMSTAERTTRLAISIDDNEPFKTTPAIRTKPNGLQRAD